MDTSGIFFLLIHVLLLLLLIHLNITSVTRDPKVHSDNQFKIKSLTLKEQKGRMRKMKISFGCRHFKLAQLYEDKGKACDGLQPSSSIWVLSSLGPGGMWQ